MYVYFADMGDRDVSQKATTGGWKVWRIINLVLGVFFVLAALVNVRRERERERERERALSALSMYFECQLKYGCKNE